MRGVQLVRDIVVLCSSNFCIKLSNDTRSVHIKYLSKRVQKNSIGIPKYL